MNTSKYIVYHTEQHTLMYQAVTLYINESLLISALDAELSNFSIQELFQAYYLCELHKHLKIKPKENYGDWNADISDISMMYKYQPLILEKIKSYITEESITKNLETINNLLGLDSSELTQSKAIQSNMKTLFLIK